MYYTFIYIAFGSFSYFTIVVIIIIILLTHMLSHCLSVLIGRALLHFSYVANKHPCSLAMLDITWLLMTLN